MEPLVSLIVPVYNAEAFLPAGLLALRGQTHRHIEIILVNDGSTDQSGDLCDRAAGEDARIRVIHQENRGVGPARNAGIAAARGEYLMFPDADDTPLPHMVATLVAAAEQSGAEVTLCGYQAFDGDGQREQVTLPEQLLEGHEAVRRFAASLVPLGVVGYPWNKLYKREFIVANHLQFPPMRRFQDGVFNLEVFHHATCVQVVAEPLYRYKLNDLTGIFQKFPADMFCLLCEITEAFYGKLSTWGLSPAEYKKNIRPFFLNGVVGCVDCLYSPAWGMNAPARRAYLRRLAAHPLVLRCGTDTAGLSRSAALVVGLLRRRRFRTLLWAARGKLTLKRHGHPLFRLLRG
ncbi:MAG: glycosyltransferase [Clostridia bacterium]|nr:glycosyltransferase [Clostridia bacterium]